MFFDEFFSNGAAGPEGKNFKLHFFADFFLLLKVISRIFCTFLRILEHCGFPTTYSSSEGLDGVAPITEKNFSGGNPSRVSKSHVNRYT